MLVGFEEVGLAVTGRDCRGEDLNNVGDSVGLFKDGEELDLLGEEELSGG